MAFSTTLGGYFMNFGDFEFESSDLKKKKSRAYEVKDEIQRLRKLNTSWHAKVFQENPDFTEAEKLIRQYKSAS
jgi:molybdopterin/thiamine biosynthesis adenylyltransferase